MSKKPQPRDLPETIAAMPWDATHGSYLAGRSHLDGVDALAAQMEHHWGCDRLRLLVSAELREKFDRQRYRLQQAIEGGTLDILTAECQRATTAYNALHAHAAANGAMPCPGTVWEVALADGTVAAIVQDDSTAKDVLAQGRAISVWTLEEIARLIDGHGAVVKAKLAFPGAIVTRTAKSGSDPLERVRHPSTLDDPLEVGDILAS